MIFFLYGLKKENSKKIVPPIYFEKLLSRHEYDINLIISVPGENGK